MIDSIQQAGIGLILFFQNLGGWLTPPMRFFTYLGQEEFFLFVAPAIYWCFSASLGLRLGLFLMIGDVAKGMFKLIFHNPRPYWYDPRVQALAVESSFGVPSGHAMDATVVWGTLAAYLKRGWTWLVAILVILLIGISRVYLGVHFPSDVIVGWLLGALILVGMRALEPPVLTRLRKLSLEERIGTAFACSLVLVLIGALSRLALGAWTIPPLWLANIAIALPGSEPIEPLALSGIISDAGVFFGLSAGAFLIAARGGFSTRGSAIQRVFRFLIGVVGVALIWYGLGAVLPRGEALLPYALRYLRYALVGVWVSLLAPLVFIRLGIAAPERQVTEGSPVRARMV